jgi:uncharacterized membrane protein
MFKLKSTFREYFLAGLIALLPLWLTLTIVWIIFKWVSNIAMPMLFPIFHILFGYDRAGILVRLVSFVVTVALIWFVGIIAKDLLGKRVLISIESVLIKVPFVKEIYLSVRKLVQFLFMNKRSFRQVVLLEFPRTGLYAIGFVMMDAPLEIQNKTGKTLVNIFVPHTPNPTGGFLLHVTHDQLIPLNMSVDEAIKMVISGGIIVPDERADAVNPT